LSNPLPIIRPGVCYIAQAATDTRCYTMAGQVPSVRFAFTYRCQDWCVCVCEFLLKHAVRILFGTDLVADIDMYGLNLPDPVLRQIHRDNSLGLLRGVGAR
jgi:hypothetical protein